MLPTRKRLRANASLESSKQCQKCLQPGHWTYECKNTPAYLVRASRSQQLRNPKLRQPFNHEKPPTKQVASSTKKAPSLSESSRSSDSSSEDSESDSSGTDSASDSSLDSESDSKKHSHLDAKS
uniref:Uncharacterized protein AlNc14C342G10813 n=1 Tax=Albugo laibachii Nc14 TaxID=890382 RepID=F0WX55_9STRA|nr:conserved hypothetical protein [Albugo laibachii Nc14]|eukprot:CCA26045.1 conserved hypothetical protein [Albugo laibachii Nc14]